MRILFSKLIQKQRISLYTPHPNPAKGGGLHKFPPPLTGGGKGEGDYVNLCIAFTLILLFLFLFIFPFSVQPKDKKTTAPNFVAKNLDGKKVRLKEVLGDGPVLISFWATWCKPCIKELDELQKLYKEYKKKGFEILAIDVDGPRSISKVRSMVKGFKWEFPVLWDKTKDIYRKYHVLGIPHTVLIDKSGEIRYTHTTYRPGDEEVIKKKIQELLDEQKQASKEKEGEEKSER